MSDITLQLIGKPFSVTIRPPGSKSITNRALVLSTLAEGSSELKGALVAEDTMIMVECLTRLRFQVDVHRERGVVRMNGRGGGIERDSAELFCGNSGTTMRFLTALCALGHGRYALDGVPRMRQRPIGPLVDVLRNLGARVDYRIEHGFPPLELHADGLPGGMARFGSAESSQYLSAILMVAPYARNEVRIDLEGPQTSWPYVAMTMQLMDRFGVTPELIRDPKTAQPKQIIVPRGRYRAITHQIEPDASNASYFLAAAAINVGSKVTVEGLGKGSLQGDIGFADILHKMGASLVFGRDFITIEGTDTFEGIDIDLRDMPDLAQTLAVACTFASGESTLRGLHTLRHKETDRLAALQTELQKLGAKTRIDDDSLAIDPPDHAQPATIDTYNDHRMAMSFAVAGTRVPVVIRGAECVSKTYPTFFEDFSKLGGNA